MGIDFTSVVRYSQVMNGTISPRERAKKHLCEGLKAACEQLGWTPTKLGAEAEASAAAAFSWIAGDRAPSGECVVLLMRKHPVIAEHLLGAA
jgi:hypothetical protein